MNPAITGIMTMHQAVNDQAAANRARTHQASPNRAATGLP